MRVANHPKFDPLAQFKEGAKSVGGGAARPIPLTKTEINVAISGVFATVKTARVFKNTEAASIEATLTFPVPIDAVAHSLKVTLQGRVLAGVAQPKAQARATYEQAVDTGATAVLHEEALKGIHVLSVAHVGPGDEVCVEMSWSKPLSLVGAEPSLKIPTTVAEIYGRLPLSPADELITHDRHVFEADLTIATDSGVARLLGYGGLEARSLRVPLDRPIEIVVAGARNRVLNGRSADGIDVALSIAALPAGERAIRFGVLFDRSGSTADPIDGHGMSPISVWNAARNALSIAVANALSERDVLSLWQFDNRVEFLGEASGDAADLLIGKIGNPQGGTAIGAALEAALAQEAIRDVVVITDGRSGALDVQSLAARGKRVSAILVGANSLEAMIGHLVALTGGQIVVASSSNIAEAFAAVIAALRLPGAPAQTAELTGLPRACVEHRSGAEISAVWNDGPAGFGATVDEVGAYAAAIALPQLTLEAATQVAVAHGLCTHLTSLVVVDEAGARQAGLPNTRKVPLSRPMESAPHARVPAFRGANEESGRGVSMVSKRRIGVFRQLLDTGDQPQISETDELNMFLKFLSGQINWSEDPERLVKGDIDNLSTNLGVSIATLARHVDVVKLAERIGKSPFIVVIGLLAREAGPDNRNAARIARAILGSEGLATTLADAGPKA